MHKVAWSLLFLVLCAWFACEVEVAPLTADAMQQENVWRRTAQGWEKANQWGARAPIYRPSIHPWTVAAIQFFTAMLLLMALPAQSALASEETAASLSGAEQETASIPV